MGEPKEHGFLDIIKHIESSLGRLKQRDKNQPRIIVPRRGAFIEPEDYHQEIETRVDNIAPREQYDFTLVGLAYSLLMSQPVGFSRNYLTPAMGLTRFNINYGAEGVLTRFSYSTRPVERIKDLDILHTIVAPRLI